MYDFPLLDTSQVSVIDLSKHFTTYDLDYYSTTSIDNDMNDSMLLKLDILQSRLNTERQFARYSLDLILGLVGGFVSIIWGVLGYMINPYETFMFLNSLIGNMYPTSPQPDEDEQPISSSVEALTMLKGTIIERGKFDYTFREYYFTWFITKFCCCCIRKNSQRAKIRQFKYDRYLDAIDRVNKEIDILKHVSNQRVSDFIAKLVLRKH